MRRLFELGFVILATLFNVNAIAAPTLTVVGGMLTGAERVNVNGTLYDVSFQDGSCISLFNGCDASKFAFSSNSQTLLASQALIDQVFLNDPLGAFDATPALTRGCGDIDLCEVWTPFATSPSYVAIGAAVNQRSTLTDYAYTFGVPGLSASFSSTNSSTNGSLWVYAVWTRSPASVAAPSTLACVALGVLGLILSRRQRQPAKSVNRECLVR